MNRSKNTYSAQQSPLARAVTVFLVVCVICSKLISSFLHSHLPRDISRAVLSSAHCIACEFEATQATEPEAAFLPLAHLVQIEVVSDCIVAEVSLPRIHSIEYRGPPPSRFV